MVELFIAETSTQRLQAYRGAKDGRRKSLAALCHPHRCRQYLATHRRWAFRGIRQVRRGECPANLRRLLGPTPEVVGRHPPKIRDRSIPAVRLYDWKER